jgi:8-oxo-(d)GTP phosphatase
MSINLNDGPAGGSRIKAAGAVLWRSAADSAAPEFALIHRERYDDWSFAKGKEEPGEHSLLAAVREVEEETGLRPVLGRRLPSIEYEVLGRDKRVKYWAGQAPKSAAGHVFTPNDEVDELEWLPASEARERLTSPLDLLVLDAFLAAPTETFPIILQRHGKAEPRSAAYPDDLARPLAPAGRQQAIALTELLAVYGAEQLISSPAVRCVGTVRPYADWHGVEMQTDSALTEISYVHAPRAIVRWLRDLADRRVPTIVCTHGPLLDELIGAALYNPNFVAPEGMAGPTLSGHPWSTRQADHWTNGSLSTGCAWVLHFTATTSPRLVAVDRLKP